MFLHVPAPDSKFRPNPAFVPDRAATDLLLACEGVEPQGLSHLFHLLLLRIAVHHVVQGGHVEVEVVLQMLVVTARLQVGVAPDQTVRRNQLGEAR